MAKTLEQLRALVFGSQQGYNAYYRQYLLRLRDDRKSSAITKEQYTQYYSEFQNYRSALSDYNKQVGLSRLQDSVNAGTTTVTPSKLKEAQTQYVIEKYNIPSQTTTTYETVQVPQSILLNKQKDTAQVVAEQTAIRRAAGIYTTVPLTTDIKFSFDQDYKIQKTPFIQRQINAFKLNYPKAAEGIKWAFTPVRQVKESDFYKQQSMFLAGYFATGKYVSQRQARFITGREGSRLEKVGDFTLDTAAYGSDAFRENLITPATYPLAFAGGKVFGNLPKGFQIASGLGYGGITTYKIATSENKAKTTGEFLGTAAAYSVAYSGTNTIYKEAKVFFKKYGTSVLLAPVGMTQAKVTTFGGKQLRTGQQKNLPTRKGTKGNKPFSKAELRKRSFQAQRRNLFYDTQKNEFGTRLRSPQLKAKGVSSRTIRAQSGQVTQVTDYGYGFSKGGLTTRYPSGINYGRLPNNIRYSKLYPKGYGSQSIKVYKGGNQQLQGISLVAEFKGARSPLFTGKVPTVKNVKPPKLTQFSTGNKGGVGSVSIQQQNPFIKNVKYQQPQTTGGFRPGVKNKLFDRINIKILDNRRNVFIKDLSGFTGNLPTPNVPKVSSNININVAQPTTTFKASKEDLFLYGGLGLSTSNLPAERNKIGQETQPRFLPAFRVAQTTATDSSFKPIQIAAIDSRAVFKHRIVTTPNPQRPTPNIIIRPTPTPNPQRPTPNIIERPRRDPGPRKPDPPPRKPEFPNISLNFKKTFKTPSFKNTFKVTQPKAFRPTVRAAFLGLKGSTSKGSIITGIGERYLPNKKRRGSII